jgi:hypothetical protein
MAISRFGSNQLNSKILRQLNGLVSVERAIYECPGENVLAVFMPG